MRALFQPINILIVLAILIIIFLLLLVCSKRNMRGSSLGIMILDGIFIFILIFVVYDSYTSNHKELLFSDDYKLVKTTYINIPNGASICLETGYSALSTSSNNTFVLTDNTDTNDLDDFLNSSKKNIYFYVKDGTEILYSLDLGLSKDIDSEKVINAYNYIKDGMIIESYTYRYTIFSVFYYDKEVIFDVCK